MLRRVSGPASFHLLLAVALLATLPASAQVRRNFPQSALRGAVVFGPAPQIALNGDVARLAPGARIRDTNNMSIVPGASSAGAFW